MLGTRFAFIIALSSAAVVSCSTMHEAFSPSDSTSGYQQKTNEKGETVHRRERDLRDAPIATPLAPAPVATPVPLARTPSPQAQTNFQDETQSPYYNSENALSPRESSGYFVGGELALAENHGQLGVSVGKEIWSFVDLRGGASLFFGNDAYAGFDLGARAKLPLGNVTPFIGLGGYIGDVKKCVRDGFVEVCEKKFLSAGFTEIGLFLWDISVFFRNYNIEEAGKIVPSAHSFGIGYTARF
jgi:hypothetical protein